MSLAVVGALVAAMVGVAGITGHVQVIFPEFAALCAGVLVHRLPGMRRNAAELGVLPAAAAWLGFGLGAVPVAPVLRFSIGLLVVLAVLHVLRSMLLPVLSAALLPLLLGDHAVVYPVAVSVLCGVLVLVLLADCRHQRPQHPPPRRALARAPQLAGFWAVTSVWALVAFGTGHRLLIATPLVVAAADIFPQGRSRAVRNALVLGICGIAGAVGYDVVAVPAVDAVIMVAAVFAVLALDRSVQPPAYAIALLPLWFARGDIVGFGATVTTGAVVYLALAAWAGSTLRASTPAGPMTTATHW